MSLPGAALAEFLRRHVAGAPGVDLCIAFSGGVDSTALLLAAVGLRDAGGRSPVGPGVAAAPDDAPPAPSVPVRLRAVHVHHGLHSGADSWRVHCVDLCAALRVPLTVLNVDVTAVREHGVEAAARIARYDALRHVLRDGEWLLTAHQADDQLETLLIQLLRGAGIAGLAAMPAIAPFGPGWLGRPLLGLRRPDLAVFVAEAGVRVIADPMNDDLRFDRGWLRARVLPSLLERWPAATATVGRSAAHCATAQALLGTVAAEDARDALTGSRLRLGPLADLDPARRANVLRWWIVREGLDAPSTSRLDEIVRQMWNAAPEALPVVRWRGGEVRRYRGVLHALRKPPAALAGERLLRPGETLALGSGLGTLALSPVTGGGLRAACCAAGLRVAARRGGEEIRLHRGGPRRPLRLLLQEDGIVPWRRASLPLLWSGAELVAVADRWISADHAAAAGEQGHVPVWEGAPPLT